MSAKEQDRARTLAERIANRLAQDSGRESVASAAQRREPAATAANVGDELAALRAGLSEIGQRLTQIESHVTHNTPRTPERAPQHEHHQHHSPDQQSAQTRAPQNERANARTNSNPQHWLSSTYVPAVHPSEERFGIDEAVSELVEFFEREKVCNVEPGEKPCDHCGMCSSRGF